MSTPRVKRNRKPLRFLSPIHRASRQISRRFDRDMARSGLSAQEAHLISYVSAYAPCTVATLVEVFGVQGSTMTSMLNRLEERGILKRRANPIDARSLIIELTRAGHTAAKQIQSFIDAIEREIGGAITAADEKGFRNVMAAIDRLNED